MPVSLHLAEKGETIRLRGSCAAEELDRFLGMVKENPDARIDLRECDYFHTGFLQIILAANLAISHPPPDPFLRGLLTGRSGH